jgi:hypothetical protein
LLATDKWLTLVDDDRLSTTEVDDDASDSDDGDEQKVGDELKVKLDGSTKEDELEGTDGSPLTEVDEHMVNGSSISSSNSPLELDTMLSVRAFPISFPLQLDTLLLR